MVDAYLSRRRFKKGMSSRDGLRAKNSSDSPRSGRPLDPGGNIAPARHGGPMFHLMTKWINQAANRATPTRRTQGMAGAAGSRLPDICIACVLCSVHQS